MKYSRFNILLIMIIACTLLVTASPSFFIKNSEAYNITFSCKNEQNTLALCSNSASCNITIAYPNSTLMVSNGEATNLNNGKFRYSLVSSQTQLNGEYAVWAGCSDGGLNNSLSFSYRVTQTGEELTEGKGLVYMVLLIGTLIIFIFSVYGSIVLPFKNKRGELGNIIKIERLKYFKITLMVVTYLIFIWLINLLLTLSVNFLLLTQFTTFFTVIFNFLNAMVYPIFVMVFVFMLFMLWNDLKLDKMLDRGLMVK